MLIPWLLGAAPGRPASPSCRGGRPSAHPGRRAPGRGREARQAAAAAAHAGSRGLWLKRLPILSTLCTGRSQGLTDPIRAMLWLSQSLPQQFRNPPPVAQAALLSHAAARQDLMIVCQRSGLASNGHTCRKTANALLIYEWDLCSLPSSCKCPASAAPLSHAVPLDDAHLALQKRYTMYS